MIRCKPVIIIILLGFFLVGVQALAEDAEQWCGVPLPRVIAKVGDQEITRAELILRLSQPGSQVQRHDPAHCRALLESAIQAVLFRPEAGKYQVEVKDEEVQAEFEKVRTAFPSEEAFGRFLKERGANVDVLRRVIKDGLLLKKIEERQIKSWHFSEELQQGYFNEHRSELAKDRIKVSHILVKTSKEAEQVLTERNLKNRSFSELAIKYSLDEKTREQGGGLGWIERGKMPPEFDAVAFTLDIGLISKPVKTSLGYHLIQVEDKKLASEQTLEDHRPKVIRLLQEEEWAFQREEWWNELRGKARIWITPELIPVSENSERKETHAGHE